MLGPAHTAVDHLFSRDSVRPCGPGCELVVSVCACGLAKRERVLNGKVRTVEVRLPGAWEWQDVIDLLSVEVPYLLCPRCHGGGCDTCGELGLLERIKPRSGPRHAGVAPVPVTS